MQGMFYQSTTVVFYFFLSRKELKIIDIFKDIHILMEIAFI